MDRTLSRAPTPRLSGLITALRAILAFDRSRRRLGVLDDHLLRDIGLDRMTARHEAARAPWDVPRDIPWDAPRHWTR